MAEFAVDARAAADWIAAIDFADWPQQNRLADGQVRPAMVTDLSWHGFGAATDGLLCECLKQFPGCVGLDRMLSAVMPGHDIPPHTDNQNERWVCRVHVPLLTNPQAFFVVEDKPYHLEVGKAYLVDTRRMHAVINGGTTPRIHFMFDVVRNG